MKKASLGILIMIIGAFLLIIWAADSVGASFGKVGETLALGLVVVVLLIALIKTKGEK